MLTEHSALPTVTMYPKDSKIDKDFSKGKPVTKIFF